MLQSLFGPDIHLLFGLPLPHRPVHELLRRSNVRTLIMTVQTWLPDRILFRRVGKDSQLRVLGQKGGSGLTGVAEVNMDLLPQSLQIQPAMLPYEQEVPTSMTSAVSCLPPFVACLLSHTAAQVCCPLRRTHKVLWRRHPLLKKLLDKGTELDRLLLALGRKSGIEERVVSPDFSHLQPVSFGRKTVVFGYVEIAHRVVTACGSAEYYRRTFTHPGSDA